MARDYFDATRRHEFLDRPREVDEGCRGRPRRLQGRNRQATLGHRRCFRRQSWDGSTAHCATPVHFVGPGGAGALPRSVAPLAMEIDERVTRAILTDFDLTHSGSPSIRLKTATTA